MPALCIAMGVSLGVCRGAEPAATPAPAKPLAVYFLEVGHGDATIITTPGGKCVLIDAAGGRKGGAAVLSFLEKKGIRRIDTVVMSHADGDHIGGMPAVLESPLEVGEFLDPGYPHTTGLYQRVLKSVKSRAGTRYRTPKAGDILDWGKELTVRVLSPSGKPRSTNDSSVVIQLRYGKVAFLFTGDVGSGVEKQMVRRNGKGLRSQILKVGHHGSKSSSSEPFLLSVKPEAAIVSTGSTDPDGPYIETIDRLREAGAKVYQTGLYGMITVISDGKGYRVLTERASGQAAPEIRETPVCTAPVITPREMPAATGAGVL
ncbi:MAG: MBL fold metallo-hydrolase [Candidatus Aureabacteria bacterium]|nr:MBL fold metallo-hydrolase [Candidatus Auribacterota bacterium]